VINFILELFSGPEDFIALILNQYSHLAAPLLLLIEESGIPIPVPGDVIISYIGYQASIGKIGYVEAYLALLAAVLVGSSILYYLSSKYGQHIVLRFGKYIHLNEYRLETVERYFKKYGPWVIIFGRHIPGFRIAITIFSGISKVSYRTFILSTFISVVFWIGIYLYIGARLGKAALGLTHVHAGYAFLLAIIAILAILYYFFIRRK
jgi:membrane protein DedA with SNARE-associated domain